MGTSMLLKDIEDNREELSHSLPGKIRRKFKR